MNATYNFPELNGSPKQIAWAEDIRNGAVKMAESDVKTAEEGFASGYSLDDAKVVLAEVIDTFMAVDSAKMIIDHKASFTRFRLDEMLMMEHGHKAISKARAARK